jgi:hypothetical protein
MERKDYKSFIQGLAQMAEVFQQELSELQIKTYMNALSDMSIDSLLHAMSETIRRSTFFRLPLPGQLRELAVEFNRRKASQLPRVEVAKPDRIPVDELRGLVSKLVKSFEEKSKPLARPASRNGDAYEPKLTGDDLKLRREKLRQQAQELAGK